MILCAIIANVARLQTAAQVMLSQSCCCLFYEYIYELWVSHSRMSGLVCRNFLWRPLYHFISPTSTTATGGGTTSGATTTGATTTGATSTTVAATTTAELVCECSRLPQFTVLSDESHPCFNPLKGPDFTLLQACCTLDCSDCSIQQRFTGEICLNAL